jgi:hypothetical protein
MDPSANRLEEALQAMSAVSPPPLSPPTEALLRALTPVRTASPAKPFAATAAASLAIAVAHVVAIGTRADLPRLPVRWVVLVAFGWGAGFFAVLAATMVPKRGSMLPDPVRVAILTRVGVLGMIALGASVGGIASAPLATWDGQLRQGALCLFSATEVAVVPFIGAALGIHRTLPVDARAVGAALGAAGGALGALTLHFRCGVGGALHVGVAHGGAAIVCALIGGAVLPRVMGR